MGRGVPAGARGGHRCRSARRSTTTRRSPRSAGCSTSGITRARVHLALSWAERRETRGREAPAPAEPVPARPAAAPRPGPRIRELPGAAGRRPRRAGRSGAADDDPLFAALRAWRTARARDGRVPPYVIAHDATLRGDRRGPTRDRSRRSRVKGMGPAKLDKYGDEILAVVDADRGRRRRTRTRPPARTRQRRRAGPGGVAPGSRFGRRRPPGCGLLQDEERVERSCLPAWSLTTRIVCFAFTVQPCGR